MKKQLNLISRCALLGITAGALCLANEAFAQTKSADRDGAKGAASTTTDRADKTAGMAPGGNAKAKGGSVGEADQSFMAAAAKGGMMEVEMGKLAQKNGTSAEVKKLGSMMVTDHSKANKELMALAKKKGVTLDASKPQMASIEPGSNFDSEWLSQMDSDHQKTIKEFETEAKNGSDADVKSWAQKTLPTLQKHMKAVEAARNPSTTSKSKKSS